MTLGQSKKRCASTGISDCSLGQAHSSAFIFLYVRSSSCLIGMRWEYIVGHHHLTWREDMYTIARADMVVRYQPWNVPIQALRPRRVSSRVQRKKQVDSRMINYVFFWVEYRADGGLYWDKPIVQWWTLFLFDAYQMLLVVRI